MAKRFKLLSSFLTKLTVSMVSGAGCMYVPPSYDELGKVVGGRWLTMSQTFRHRLDGRV